MGIRKVQLFLLLVYRLCLKHCKYKESAYFYHVHDHIGWIVSPLVFRGPWMSTVVLYCWCHSDSASVLLYFTCSCSWEMHLIDEQITKRTALRFVWLVCFSLKFISHEHNKTDTHSWVHWAIFVTWLCYTCKISLRRHTISKSCFCQNLSRHTISKSCYGLNSACSILGESSQINA